MENSELFLDSKACVELIAQRLHGGIRPILQGIRETRQAFNSKLDSLQAAIISQSKASSQLLSQLYDRLDFHHTRNLSKLDQKIATEAGEAWRKVARTYKAVEPLPEGLPTHLVRKTPEDKMETNHREETVQQLSQGLRAFPKPRCPNISHAHSPHTHAPSHSLTHSLTHPLPLSYTHTYHTHTHTHARAHTHRYLVTDPTPVMSKRYRLQRKNALKELAECAVEV